jgi:hypothetical protein
MVDGLQWAIAKLLILLALISQTSELMAIASQVMPSSAATL